MFRTTLFALLILSLAMPLSAKDRQQYGQDRPLTPEMAALVQQAIAREKVTIKEIQQRAPVVETYIQDMQPDAMLYQVPVNDDYILSRVAFNKAFSADAYERKSESDRGFLSGSRSALARISHALGLGANSYSPSGFMDMMFVDPAGFDEQHYAFNYVRREFLGSVRTCVFEIHPKTSGIGRFYG